MNWRGFYCPVCSNRELVLWGKLVACQDCESADKPIRFKEEQRGGLPRTQAPTREDGNGEP